MKATRVSGQHPSRPHERQPEVRRPGFPHSTAAAGEASAARQTECRSPPRSRSRERSPPGCLCQRYRYASRTGGCGRRRSPAQLCPCQARRSCRIQNRRCSERSPAPRQKLPGGRPREVSGQDSSLASICLACTYAPTAVTSQTRSACLSETGQAKHDLILASRDGFSLCFDWVRDQGSIWL